MPREFLKDGRQFVTRCSKRTSKQPPPAPSAFPVGCGLRLWDGVSEGHRAFCANIHTTADRREFLRISQAVGMGFLIMGVIGYVVKLSELALRSRSVAGMGTDVLHQYTFL